MANCFTSKPVKPKNQLRTTLWIFENPKHLKSFKPLDTETVVTEFEPDPPQLVKVLS